MVETRRVTASSLLIGPSTRSSEARVVNLALSRSYLQEATLLSWRYEAVARALGLILDLRYALEIENASIGVLVSRNTFMFEWMEDHRHGPPIWYSLTGLTLGVSHPFSLTLGFEPGAELSIDADEAILYIGTAAISAGAPPDFSQLPIDALAALLPTWETQMDVIAEVALTTQQKV